MGVRIQQGLYGKPNALHAKCSHRWNRCMSKKEIQLLLDKADDSHAAAKILIDKGFIGFSAAQSYYTIFYLVEALLLSKGLRFSSHSALIASYGKEFAKTG